MKTWKPLCVWWTLRNKQNEVNNVWMFLWKFVVMLMLQVVYRVHYVLWCCLVCLQHYFCLHTPDYSVGKVEWERKKERKKENSHSISISITFPHFIIVFQQLSSPWLFFPLSIVSTHICFILHFPTTSCQKQTPKRNNCMTFNIIWRVKVSSFLFIHK